MPAADHTGTDGSLGCEDGERLCSRNDEEAARLLPTEHFDIEDNNETVADPAKRRWMCTWQWLAGPAEPRRQKVKPFLPSIQRLPIQVVDRLISKTKYRVVAFATFLLLWAAAFVPLLLAGGRLARDNSDMPVVNLDCIDSFWGSKNACGPDGVDCQPFSELSFAFRCPPGCAAVQLLNPRAIGPVEVIYRPLVVGTEVYRGDSWVCASAIHAGVFSDGSGGCGRVSLAGHHSAFSGVEGRGGMRSIAFDSYFPLSFTISEEPGGACQGESRGVLLLVSLLFTAMLSLCTTSPSLIFFATMTAGLIHVDFVSDPPEASFHNISVLPDRTSKFAERFLPAAFCLVVLYRTCVRPTLVGLDAQFEKTLLWLGGFWFGALSNYTFGWLPIQRLTAHDLEQQPGAQASLAVILIILALIVAQQIHFLWLEGRLIQYLALYGLFLAGVLICLAIPSVKLRLHHYIIALLLLPGTSMQTRPSLLYQGILLGLFVNGIARWGFASVLETPDALRGDGTFGSLTPVVSIPSISLATVSDAVSNISFTWEPPPASAHINGISVLVNDVERLRRFFAPGGTSSMNFMWTRLANLHLPEYFRFAFSRDGLTLDYTRAGTWVANGTWEMPTT
ncbi:hypothetical protein DV736_g6679, partial [Chaetothyriales sp. CBS 134916]